MDENIFIRKSRYVCMRERGGQTEIKDTHSFFQQTWSIPSELGVKLDTGTQRWRESVNTFNKRHSGSANKGRERGVFRGGLESIGQHMNMWIFMWIALFPPSTQLPFGHPSQGGHGHSNNTPDWFISLQNTCWLLLSIVGSSKHQTRIPTLGWHQLQSIPVKVHGIWQGNTYAQEWRGMKDQAWIGWALTCCLPGRWSLKGTFQWAGEQ